MKRCATCNQTYSDDLMFCLSDGTPLVSLSGEIEQQTVIRPIPASPAAKSANNARAVFKYVSAALALVLVLVLLVGVAAVWILWQRSEGTAANNTPPKNDMISSAASPVPTSVRTPYSSNENNNQPGLKEEELERERRRLADERKKLPRFNDPGTARISFRRGSVGETVSGTVSRSRSYVLRAASGQYLSASVNSAGGCVVFSSGSSSTAFTTGGGDTRLTVQNNCDQPSTFSMSVTVR